MKMTELRLESGIDRSKWKVRTRVWSVSNSLGEKTMKDENEFYMKIFFVVVYLIISKQN